MNQASRVSSVVPVLPATGRPSFLHPLPRSAFDDVLHDVARHEGDPRIDHLLHLRLRLLEDMARPVDDLLDEEGLHPLPLVRQDAVGPDQLLEGDPGGAEGHREVPGEGRGDPHVGRVGGGVIHADLLEDLDRDDVPGVDQGVVQRRRPEEFLVEILRFPDPVGLLRDPG